MRECNAQTTSCSVPSLINCQTTRHLLAEPALFVLPAQKSAMPDGRPAQLTRYQPTGPTPCATRRLHAKAPICDQRISGHSVRMLTVLRNQMIIRRPTQWFGAVLLKPESQFYAIGARFAEQHHRIGVVNLTAHKIFFVEQIARPQKYTPTVS
jgi:hypothetical protein